MPMIVPVARGHLVEKLAANLQEVHARGGCLLLFVQPVDLSPEKVASFKETFPIESTIWRSQNERQALQ